MEAISLFAKQLSDKAAMLLQTYKKANDIVSKSNSLDDRVLAYNEVINFCMNSPECRNEDNIKRNTILYWAYHNMADALVKKNYDKPQKKVNSDHYFDALKYYNSALSLSSSNFEKIETLGKISDVHRKLGDVKSWMDIRKGLIEYFDNDQKRRAYAELADEAEEIDHRIDLLEHSLNYVKHEKLPAKEKCENTLAICASLMLYYEQKSDEVNLARIEHLAMQTEALISKKRK